MHSCFWMLLECFWTTSPNIRKKPFCRIETKTIQSHPLGSIKIRQDALCWGPKSFYKMVGGCWEYTLTYINIIQYPSISINILQYDTKNAQLLLDAFGMFLEHLTKYQKKPFCRIETKTIQSHPLGSIKIRQDALCWGPKSFYKMVGGCWEYTLTYINIIQYPSISTNILQFDTKKTQLLLDAFGMFLEHLTKYQKKPFCRMKTKTIQNHPLGPIKIHQDALCWGPKSFYKMVGGCWEYTSTYINIIQYPSISYNMIQKYTVAFGCVWNVFGPPHQISEKTIL